MAGGGVGVVVCRPCVMNSYLSRSATNQEYGITYYINSSIVNDFDGRHDNGDGRHTTATGGTTTRHDNGKGQQGDRRHDDFDGWHDDGKGQQGDRRHDDGDERAG